MGLVFRAIEERDNQALADLIRAVFREFKIDKPGTMYTDPITDNLFALFQKPKSKYWVSEEDGIVLGGCGIYPTDGLPDGCAELARLYLSPQSRGKGIGKILIEKSIESAKELGYKQLYLESFPELANAVNIYKKIGFKIIDHPMGNSGHYACTIWAVIDI